MHALEEENNIRLVVARRIGCVSSTLFCLTVREVIDWPDSLSVTVDGFVHKVRLSFVGGAIEKRETSLWMEGVFLEH